MYDAEDLAREIKRLAERSNLATDFFEWRRDRAVSALDGVCQGDIVHLAADVPLVAEDGQPFVAEHPGGMWLVIGNTCDFDREDAQWTQMVPVVDLGPAVRLTTTQRDALRKYTQSRTFHVPAWTPEVAGGVHVADLLRPVAVDKRVFAASLARVDARLSRAAWVLLNACLVRFLARDDGRYDP